MSATRWIGHIVLFLATCTALAAYSADVTEVKLTRVSEEAAGDNQKSLAFEGDFAVAGCPYHVQIHTLLDNASQAVKLAHIYITANKEEGYSDCQTVPRVLGVNGKLFNCQFKPADNLLTLAPHEDPCGAIQVPINVERLSLNQGSSGTVLWYRPGRRAPAPTGAFSLDQYQTVEKDKNGKVWYLCAGGTKQSPPIEVREGRKTKLTIGPPYRPEVLLPDGALQNAKQNPGGPVPMDFVLRGRGQENALEVYPIQREGPRPPPKFVIKGADGSEATGNFEYG